jgi:uncharacterized protein (TIGR03382 family)
MKIAVFACALAAVSASASASLIVSWNSTGMAGTEASMPVSGSDANVAGVVMTRGAGLIGNSGGNSLNSAGFNQASDDFVELGFTVAAGYQVDLTSFTTGTRSSGTGPKFMALYYSGDGFASPLLTIDHAPGANFVNGIYGLSLTGLTGNVTFRFMQVGNVSANGGTTGANGTWRVGDYSDGANFTDTFFDGRVTQIPTPGALALLGLGGLVAGRRRR